MDNCLCLHLQASGRVELRAEPSVLRGLIRGSPDLQHHGGMHRTRSAAAIAGAYDDCSNEPVASSRLSVVTAASGREQGGLAGVQLSAPCLGECPMAAASDMRLPSALLLPGRPQTNDLLVVSTKVVQKEHLWAAQESVYPGSEPDKTPTAASIAQQQKPSARCIPIQAALASLRAFARTIREHPRVLALPLVLLVLCTGLGVLGVTRAAQQVRASGGSAQQSICQPCA